MDYDPDEFEEQYEDELEAMLELEGDVGSKRKKCEVASSDEDPGNKEVPQVKRARTTPDELSVDDILAGFSDDDDLTPPPSPDVIDLIKQRRELFASQRQLSRKVPQAYTNGKDFLSSRRYVTRSIPNGPYFGVTTNEGSRVYMNLRSQQTLDKQILAVTEQQKSADLLTTAVPVLRAYLEEQENARAIERSVAITQNAHLHRVTPEVKVPSGPESNKLWVDSYSPKYYTDLLSDESINRLLLKWLKQWDHVVFKKEVKVKLTKPDTSQAAKTKKKWKPEVIDELDEHKRPLQKVSLLSGPPGLGKTTLAHVIAKHAGYNVVEINASDDRNLDLFRQKVEAATQMQAVMGGDPRPNCLIIDEIDGAPAPAINYLLDLIRSNPGVTKKTLVGRKKKKKQALLLRPIICICNDLFVPALRNLRQVALSLTFPPTITDKLAYRLLEISRYESLRTDMFTLMALCEKTDNDIRSCINTLQFVRGQCEQFSLQHVHTASVGKKDIQKSLFVVWRNIFQLPRQKRKQYINPHDRGTAAGKLEPSSTDHASQSNTSMTSRFHDTLHLVQAAGDYNKMIQGLHENYLKMKYKDPNLDALQCASEWFCFSDIVNEFVGRTQNYSASSYLAFLPVTFHLLFASSTFPKVSYPHMDFETFQKRQRSEQYLESMLSEVSPAVKRSLNTTIAVTECLNPLLDIIRPPLRAVNPHLYSSKEKKDYSSLIAIMIAYNMTYTQEQSQDGTFNYVLDPCVDHLITFPGIEAKKQLSYALKQMVAIQITADKLKRGEDKVEAQSTTSINRMKEVKELADVPPEDDASKKTTRVPNHLRQTLEAKPFIPKEERPDMDFFGMRLKRLPKEENASVGKMRLLKGDVFFKFKTGYTNAVRRPLEISQLL